MAKPKKTIGLRIDAELNDRWNRVCEKLKYQKSSMIEEMLEEILPILEAQEPRDFARMALRKVGTGLNEVADLLENAEKR